MLPGWIPWCGNQRDANPHLDHMLFFSSDQSQKQADSRSPSSVMGHAGPARGKGSADAGAPEAVACGDRRVSGVPPSRHHAIFLASENLHGFVVTNGMGSDAASIRPSVIRAHRKKIFIGVCGRGFVADQLLNVQSSCNLFLVLRAVDSDLGSAVRRCGFFRTPVG